MCVCRQVYVTIDDEQERNKTVRKDDDDACVCVPIICRTYPWCPGQRHDGLDARRAWRYLWMGVCVCMYVWVCVCFVCDDGVEHGRNLPRPHVGAAVGGRKAAVEERKTKRRMLLRTRMVFVLVLCCVCVCVCVCNV